MDNFGLDKKPFLSDRADNNTAEIIDELRDAVGDGVCLVGLLLRVDEEA